jgi:hypothetical protein
LLHVFSTGFRSGETVYAVQILEGGDEALCEGVLGGPDPDAGIIVFLVR